MSKPKSPLSGVHGGSDFNGSGKGNGKGNKQRLDPLLLEPISTLHKIEV
jgi:hypothetical protein